MEKRIAFIMNYPSHYRSGIFKKLNDELSADFYFGEIKNSSIKKLDFKELSNFVKEFKTIKISNSFWYIGSICLIFKPYSHYVLIGDPHILSNWLLLLLAKLTRKKMYLWTHGWYGKERGIKKYIKKLYFKLADEFFLYGDYSRNLLVKQGFNIKNLHVVYNSLDYDEVFEIRKNLVNSDIYTSHFNNVYPVLLFIGRIEVTKKLDNLLSVVKNMNETENKVNLVIIGDGIDKVNLEELAKKNRIDDKVWFYGPCYDEKVIGRLIYNSDLCVSPGNVGLTAIHSMSYGTPVITHNDFPRQGPEFEAIIPGVTGDFFENDSENSLQQSIERWLKKHPKKDESLINTCYNSIDNKFNPYYQLEVFQSVLKY